MIIIFHEKNAVINAEDNSLELCNGMTSNISERSVLFLFINLSRLSTDVNLYYNLP